MTTARHELFFRPAARLQVVLSEELVADPNVAVLEFVKNAYDAEAQNCLVHFELGKRSRDGRLTIADDGFGMDLTGITENFMRPGFSEKAEFSPDDDEPNQRVPVGEKGLGRLAAGRLGEQFDLFTRKSESEPWLHLGFRWADFNDMKTPLDEVPVWVEEGVAPPEQLADHGTVVVISRLRMRWDGRVPGRKVKGRATTRLGRLRQDLELLALPLQAGDLGFTIDLKHNSSLKEDADIVGAIESAPLELLDYQFDFAVDHDDSRWVVLRTVRRSNELASRLGVPRVTEDEADITDFFPAQESVLDFADVGDFDASVYYTPESAEGLANIRAPVGVRIYRDSVRIDPYGMPGDDWLGVAAYKASRQGHAGITPKALYGAVRISRRSNPELRPVANREGLLEGEILEGFLTVCRAQLRWFNDIVRDEYREPKTVAGRVERQADERAAEALTVQRYAVGITRATVHALRTPVAAAGAELHRLQHTIDSTSMADDLRARLQDLHDRTAEHLERMDAVADRMMRFLTFDPTPVTTDLAKVVADALAGAQPEAASRGVTLRNLVTDANEVTLPGGLIERALEELLANAIRAPRSDDMTPQVSISARREARRLHVVVTDNATGIPEIIQNQLFREAVSTAGHIGVGLLFIRQLLALARCELTFQTDATGTTFDIALPT